MCPSEGSRTAAGYSQALLIGIKSQAVPSQMKYYYILQTSQCNIISLFQFSQVKLCGLPSRSGLYSPGRENLIFHFGNFAFIKAGCRCRNDLKNGLFQRQGGTPGKRGGFGCCLAIAKLYLRNALRYAPYPHGNDKKVIKNIYFSCVF